MARRFWTGQAVLMFWVAISSVTLITCFVSGHLSEREQQPDEITLKREQIFVKFDNGYTFDLMMDLNDLVSNLFNYIDEYEGTGWDRVELWFANTKMIPRQRLSDYNIHAGDVITLTIPEEQRHTATTITNITIITHDCQQLQLETQLDKTVLELKNNITNWTGIAHADLRVLLKGKELKDDRKLINYNILNGTALKLAAAIEDCRRGVTLFVKTLDGAKRSIEVDLAGTADNLKEQIWQSIGVPTSVQRLSISNRVMITGQDHLCDLGLDEGSILYMYLYSSQITSIDQVARLSEPPAVSRPDREGAPIFREIEDELTPRVHHRPKSTYKDERNWIENYGQIPPGNPYRFCSVAYLNPNPDSDLNMNVFRRELDIVSRRDPDDLFPFEVALMRAHLYLSSVVRQYRLAANITSRRAGITLGGEADDREASLPLGADVNNWAPDAFDDLDVMRLFELSERVRQLLTRSAHTGEGILSIKDQEILNRVILQTYLQAVAGFPLASEYSENREHRECAICHDNLMAEPALKLQCGHLYHSDCLVANVAYSLRSETYPKCPYCRSGFMIHFDAIGEAELAKPVYGVYRE